MKNRKPTVLLTAEKSDCIRIYTASNIKKRPTDQFFDYAISEAIILYAHVTVNHYNEYKITNIDKDNQTQELRILSPSERPLPKGKGIYTFGDKTLLAVNPKAIDFAVSGNRKILNSLEYPELRKTFLMFPPPTLISNQQAIDIESLFMLKADMEKFRSPREVRDGRGKHNANKQKKIKRFLITYIKSVHSKELKKITHHDGKLNKSKLAVSFIENSSDLKESGFKITSGSIKKYFTSDKKLWSDIESAFKKNPNKKN